MISDNLFPHALLCFSAIQSDDNNKGMKLVSHTIVEESLKG